MSTWTTKEGKTINIADMTDSHLLNAYRMVIRIFNRDCVIAINRCYGFDDAETLGSIARDFKDEKIEPLEKEIQKRNLTVNELDPQPSA